MRIGIHCSTSGSLERAALKAHELGANAVQIFSASPRMWRTKLPDPAQVAALKLAREQHDIAPLIIHDSYLINLASPPGEIRAKSIQGFAGELERALILGADHLVAHPGNYKGLSIEQGILNVAEGIALAWRSVPDCLKHTPKLTLLLENTAGAGAQLGGKLEELHNIRQLTAPYLDIPIGYCIDTCHCYVSGWDIASESGLNQFIFQAKQTLGLEHIPVFHTNDTKMQLASHCDRHANIGDGYIGVEGFRRILNHPELCEKAFILETPVDEPGDDLRNVNTLKELVSRNEPTNRRRSNKSGSRVGRKTRRST